MMTESFSRNDKSALISTVNPSEEVFVFPLSFAQQRLWFLEQWRPGSAAYNIPLWVHLTGPLDLTLLDRSLQALMQRHETLRTTVQLADQQPRQCITPTLRLPLL